MYIGSGGERFHFNATHFALILLTFKKIILLSGYRGDFEYNVHISTRLILHRNDGGYSVSDQITLDGLIMVPRSRNATTTQTLRRRREPLWFCVGF